MLLKFRKFIPYIRNKYIVTTAIFVTWLLFFDRNDMITQISTRHKLSKLQREKQYYLDEIENNRNDLTELMSNPANLEKFGREKYLMKKDNEDVFVMVKQ